jgi:hypothetical protein
MKGCTPLWCDKVLVVVRIMKMRKAAPMVWGGVTIIFNVLDKNVLHRGISVKGLGLG